MKFTKALLIILTVMSAFEARLRKRRHLKFGPKLSASPEPSYEKPSDGDSELNHSKFGPSLSSSSLQQAYESQSDTGPEPEAPNYFEEVEAEPQPEHSLKELKQNIKEKIEVAQEALTKYRKSERKNDLTEMKKLGFSLAEEIQLKIELETNQRAKIRTLREKLRILKIIMEPTFEEAAKRYLSTQKTLSKIISLKTSFSDDGECSQIRADLLEKSFKDRYFLSTFLKEAASSKRNRNAILIRCFLNFIFFYNHLPEKPHFSKASLTGDKRKELITDFVELAKEIASDTASAEIVQTEKYYFALIRLISALAPIEFDYYLTELEFKLRTY